MPVDATPAPPREAQLVARAKREGSVAIYSSQSPTSLADFAAKFKAKYGIDVTVNRQIDTTTVQQVTTEHTTGRHIADLWIVAARPYVLGALEERLGRGREGGPALFSKRYDRTKLAKPGKAFVVGTAIASFAWNSSGGREGCATSPTSSTPTSAAAGSASSVPGVPARRLLARLPRGEVRGRTSSRLAALKPKLYVSSFPLQNALAAGEVAAAVFVTPQTLDLKAQGAPVDFRLTPGGSWNSPWWGMILRRRRIPPQLSCSRTTW